jgi:orotate phosphoribosyltransferase
MTQDQVLDEFRGSAALLEGRFILSSGLTRMFAEPEGGQFQVRRGFSILPGERVLMVEDVVWTGLSSRESLDAIRGHRGELVGAAYPADQLPPELAAIPAIKPGSRGLAA